MRKIVVTSVMVSGKNITGQIRITDKRTLLVDYSIPIDESLMQEFIKTGYTDKLIKKLKRYVKKNELSI